MPLPIPRIPRIGPPAIGEEDQPTIGQLMAQFQVSAPPPTPAMQLPPEYGAQNMMQGMAQRIAAYKQNRAANPLGAAQMGPTGASGPAGMNPAIQAVLQKNGAIPPSGLPTSDTMGQVKAANDKYEVAQDSMDEALRAKRQGQLEGLKDIAEGAGKFYAPTTGDILFGQKRPEPVMAENIRGAMARNEAEMPRAAKRGLEKATGISGVWDLPTNETARLFPGIAAILKAREQTPLQQERVDLQKAENVRKQTQGDQNLKLREAGQGIQQEGLETRKDQADKHFLQTQGQDFSRAASVENNAFRAAKLARQAITSGTQTGINAARTLLQKAAGDSGNISQSEQAQYGHRIALIDRMLDSVEQYATGHMREGQKADILQLIDIYEQGHEDTINKLAQLYANRTEQLTGRPAQEVKDKYLQPQALMPNGGGQQTDWPWVKAPDGSVRQVHPEDVEKAKSMGGKVVNGPNG